MRVVAAVNSCGIVSALMRHPAGLTQRVDAFDAHRVVPVGDVGGNQGVDTPAQEPLVAQRRVVDPDPDPDAEVLGAQRFPQPGPHPFDAGPGGVNPGTAR